MKTPDEQARRIAISIFIADDSASYETADDACKEVYRFADDYFFHVAYVIDDFAVFDIHFVLEAGRITATYLSTHELP